MHDRLPWRSLFLRSVRSGGDGVHHLGPRVCMQSVTPEKVGVQEAQDPLDSRLPFGDIVRGNDRERMGMTEDRVFV
jgi:hypothetical protein